MSMKKNYSMALIALLGGIIGGFLSHWLSANNSVAFAKNETGKRVIVAHEFRVVDKSENIIARFYGKSEADGATIQFTKITKKSLNASGLSLDSPSLSEAFKIKYKNEKEKQEKAGTKNITSRHGEYYASLNKKGLQFNEKSAFYNRTTKVDGNGLAIHDEKHTLFGLPLLSVGYHDRTLCFDCDISRYPFIQFAHIPSKGEKAMQGFMGKQQIRIGLYDEGYPYLAMGNDLFYFDEPPSQSISGSHIYMDKSGLSLTDEDNKVRTILGSTKLVNVKTDSVEVRPLSSLVLFNSEGNVIWKVP